MGVLFPAFSRMMDDPQRRRDALMFSTQVLTVLLAPMMFGLWAVAEPAMLVIFGQNWAYAWPVLGLLALSKAILTPCSTFIPYLKGAGYGRVLFWSATIRAVVTTVAVWLAALYGTLIDAMVWLCIVNAITLVAYSWAVFKASDTPFFRGLYVSSRPMIAALVMAVAVRYLLHLLAERVPNATLQVLIGAAVGGLIYAVLILLTERALLGKILGMVKSRRMRDTTTQG
jgi:succinoglycan exporter